MGDMADQPEQEIIEDELDTSRENPSIALAESVAELENKEPTDLSTMYECVDGVLDNIFSNPPAPEAQMQIEFSYEAYRITIDQNGTARFVKTGEP